MVSINRASKAHRTVGVGGGPRRHRPVDGADAGAIAATRVEANWLGMGRSSDAALDTDTMNTTHETDEGVDDLGEAMASLGGSMDGFGERLAALQTAVEDLQASTQRVSENQRAVSESLARAADCLKGEVDAERGDDRIDSATEAASATAADD